MANQLDKLVRNWVEYQIWGGTISFSYNGEVIGTFKTAQITNKTIVIPTWWWGGGSWLDRSEINAMIDVKIRDYDNVFTTTTGLYKILNAMDEEDELWLTEWDTWADIVSDQSSMNLISHSWSVMTMIASSEIAINEILGDSDALSEIVDSWVSMQVLANSELAINILFSNSDALSAILNSSVAIDAVVTSDIAIEQLLKNQTLSSSTWSTLFSNTAFASAVCANDTYLWYCANNLNATIWLMANTAWNSVLADYSKIDIFLSNSTCNSYILANETSANLWWDAPLRSIINNNLLSSYIWKDDRAYNGIITFDIDSSSAETFNISRNGYNAATSSWKISVDGGEWDEQSVSASTSPLWVSLWSTGKHTVVVKPSTYAVWWARQMWNKNTTNYWTTSWLTFSIRNLPWYAFMASSSSYATSYFMAYAFYGVTSLTWINIKIPTWATSTGNYYLYYLFQWCTNLTSLTWVLLASGVTTAGNYFMGYMLKGCSSLQRLPSWFDLSGITTSIGTYFLYYCMSWCSSLDSLPTWFKLPSVWNSSYYCRYVWQNCTSLNANSPTEDLKFINAASNCFSGSGISTTSPSAWSTIAVHRT